MTTTETTTMTELQRQQLDAFQTDGYVLIRGLFDADEMAGLLRYSKGDRGLDADTITRKDSTGGESRLALRNELDDDSMYSALVRSERIAGTMQRLLGCEIYHYHHKMMLKEPRVGGAWEWHQDYGYWYNFGCLYPDMASALIAVDRATRENGCLQVLRGSHKIGRIEHGMSGEQVGADMTRVEQAMKRHELVYCEMQPGDVLFFHANVLHRSDKNESDQPRWSLICCYNARHNDPFLDGYHARYSPLQQWPDDRVRSILTGAV